MSPPGFAWLFASYLLIVGGHMCRQKLAPVQEFIRTKASDEQRFIYIDSFSRHQNLPHENRMRTQQADSSKTTRCHEADGGRGDIGFEVSAACQALGSSSVRGFSILGQLFLRGNNIGSWPHTYPMINQTQGNPVGRRIMWMIQKTHANKDWQFQRKS